MICYNSICTCIYTAYRESPRNFDCNTQVQTHTMHVLFIFPNIQYRIATTDDLKRHRYK